MRRLLEALDRLLEAVGRVRKARGLRPLERKLEQAMAKAFRRQGEEFLRRFQDLRAQFPEAEPAITEAVRMPGWEPLFDEAAVATVNLFSEPLEDATRKALEIGGTALLGDIGLGFAFNLKNPRAVRYLERVGAQRVSRVNQATKDIIRGIVTEGVETNATYDGIAQSISGRFREFAVGRPQQHIASRAHLVAVTEMAEAYSEGNQIVAQDLAQAGLDMEKSWLTMGDDRVSKGCQENEDADWIPLDDPFPSGDQRTPRFPGCRCDILYRRKADERPAEVAAEPAEVPGEVKQYVQAERRSVEDWKDSEVMAMAEKDEELPYFVARDDKFTRRMCDEQGFAGKPELVDDLAPHVEQGETELWRGLKSTEHAEQFRTGDHFVGQGTYGSGTYTAYGTDAESIAQRYAQDNEAGVLRMVLRQDARVATYEELVSLGTELDRSLKGKMQKAFAKALAAGSTDFSAANRLMAMRQIAGNPGRLATLLGYDAVRIEQQHVMLVVNRTAVRVLKGVAK